LAEGQTTTVDQSSVQVQTDGGSLRHVQAAASLGDVVNALNALGATPRDLIAIFQALRTAGALHAEIEVQ
ncbi:MAG: flagellar basal body P-ring protein FlgI, partial [Sandaracinaceae bacterium]